MRAFSPSSTASDTYMSIKLPTIGALHHHLVHLEGGVRACFAPADVPLPICLCQGLWDLPLPRRLSVAICTASSTFQAAQLQLVYKPIPTTCQGHSACGATGQREGVCPLHQVL